MKFRIRENKTLRKLSDAVFRCLGANVYLIMGIMSLLFVFSGLVVGLLGRGWIAAWLFVLTGLILGFWPCLRFLMGEPPKVYEEDFGYYESYAMRHSENKEPVREEPPIDPKELDAVIADLQAKLAAETKRREDEKKQSEEDARARALEEERLRNLLKEARRRDESREKERRRQNEENSARWNRTRGKRVYKAEKASSFEAHGGSTGGYFAGVGNTEELKKRYKELMKKHHPDNGGSADEMNRVIKEYKELELFFRSYEKHRKK